MLIREGKLRKDFYYRLSVMRIDVPSLRERKEDIKEITENFISHYNTLLSKNIKGLSEEVWEKFYEYNWPGNIRELKNTIESAMNMVDDGEVLTKEFFENKITMVGDLNNDSKFTGDLSLNNHLEEVEKAIITKIYKKNGENITRTADELKISRQNLQYKLKKYNL